MWRSLWPGRDEEEVPIGHITNGVHTLSWISPAWRFMFDERLGSDWQERMDEPELWIALRDVQRRDVV